MKGRLLSEGAKEVITRRLPSREAWWTWTGESTRVAGPVADGGVRRDGQLKRTTVKEEHREQQRLAYVRRLKLE
ncbi:hypothetical protein LAZ67_20001236 [Cordylochernes scorpioides]|uniref:Uncharacterized protein n=1 Tax=Cordylochernes scorpioides TaxID=51811 RepID=A0ABY6LMN6_9ARAC|nr:hypothetical protein LAZ67_20001236 [Cordylochernes scorpioides]